MVIGLTDEEKRALLRCRYAARHDRGGRPAATEDEAYAEQLASQGGAIDFAVWTGLQRAGLITPRTPLRCTAAGLAALKDEP